MHEKIPKFFAEFTTTGNDSYPIYQRRYNKRTVQVNSVELDNRWVVSYAISIGLSQLLVGIMIQGLKISDLFDFFDTKQFLQNASTSLLILIQKKLFLSDCKVPSLPK